MRYDDLFFVNAHQRGVRRRRGLWRRLLALLPRIRIAEGYLP